jgi:hypothetical protein
VVAFIASKLVLEAMSLIMHRADPLDLPGWHIAAQGSPPALTARPTKGARPAD